MPVTEKTAASAAPKPAAGRVAFVGAGPGDEGLLTLRAAALLGQADLVVASPEIAGRVRHLLLPEAVVADSGALSQDPRLLVKAAKAGQLAIRLYSGDPFLFCHAAAEAAACVKARVPVEIVPGVPSATAVPSRRPRPQQPHGRKIGRAHV